MAEDVSGTEGASEIRVILAANRSLPLQAIASHLVRELAALPLDAVVLLRRPAKGNPAAFEVLCAELCATLGISVEWHAPDTGHNRAGTYERDVSMARAADSAICYFSPDTPMDGGTGHIAERCIEEETLLRAYVWEPTLNELDLIGTVEVDQGL